LVEEALKQFGGLNILVNCAGISMLRNAVTATEEEWDRCMDVNLRGAWFSSKAAIRPMIAQGGGSIVNIASTHAFRTQPNHFPYQSAKAGMIAMGLSMSVDFGGHGIRVNNICPGLIATTLADEEWEQYSDPEQARSRILEIHPLGRIGKPEDVANAALFLASDEADFVTGINLVVDGGRSAVTQDLSRLMK
jgi:NAD(P)-dependent dehydrogenase (short-subunit alcohol dehydrogenase family)